MAFVGFKSAADATSALSYFNNSFIDTFRIAVEVSRAGRQAGGTRGAVEGGREGCTSHHPLENPENADTLFDADRGENE